MATDFFSGIKEANVTEYEMASRTLVIAAISNPIAGKYGSFRTITTNDGKKFNVDAGKVSNAELFTPNSEALVTKTTRSSDGVSWISSVNFLIKDGRGAFILK